MNWNPWAKKSAESREEALLRLQGELDALRAEKEITEHFETKQFRDCWKLITATLAMRKAEIFHKINASSGEGTNHAYTNGRLAEMEYFLQLPDEIVMEKKMQVGSKTEMLNKGIKAQKEAIGLEYEP